MTFSASTGIETKDYYNDIREPSLYAKHFVAVINVRQVAGLKSGNGIIVELAIKIEPSS